MDDDVKVQHRLRELVAEEVRALLARRRLNGAKLAQAIGKSEMYVSRRLRGETAFDLDDMEKIADALGVPVSKLMPGNADTLQNRRLAERTAVKVTGHGPHSPNRHRKPDTSRDDTRRPRILPRPTVGTGQP